MTCYSVLQEKRLGESSYFHILSSIVGIYVDVRIDEFLLRYKVHLYTEACPLQN